MDQIVIKYNLEGRPDIKELAGTTHRLQKGGVKYDKNK